MNIKVFILILVALALLFTGAAVSGSLKSSNDPARPTADWQANLLNGFDSLIPKGKVNGEDLRRALPTDCWQSPQIVVQAGAECRYYFNPAKGPRRLTLNLIEGKQAELALTQPVNQDGDTVTSKPALDNKGQANTVDPVLNGQTVRFDIYRQQSDSDRITLVVRCFAETGTNCKLSFVK
jgi:hypothetical protein